ncbi:unnamed protein product, partial [Rotaria sp. Silwood2]
MSTLTPRPATATNSSTAV